MINLQLSEWKFRDATVSSLKDDGDLIVIELSDVYPENTDICGSQRMKVRIEIKNPHMRMVERQRCSTFSFLFDDGEVVFIKVENNTFSAVIIWTDYKSTPTKNCTLFYSVDSEDIVFTKLEAE